MELAFPDPPLADECVLLRPWTVDDLPAKFRGFADPTVQRFVWPKTAEYTEADARSNFEVQEEARLRGEEINFALAEPAHPDVVLGAGSIYDVDLEQGRAGVGFWLAPEARG